MEKRTDSEYKRYQKFEEFLFFEEISIADGECCTIAVYDDVYGEEFYDIYNIKEREIANFRVIGAERIGGYFKNPDNSKVSLDIEFKYDGEFKDFMYGVEIRTEDLLDRKRFIKAIAKCNQLVYRGNEDEHYFFCKKIFEMMRK